MYSNSPGFLLSITPHSSDLYFNVTRLTHKVQRRYSLISLLHSKHCYLPCIHFLQPTVFTDIRGRAEYSTQVFKFYLLFALVSDGLIRPINPHTFGTCQPLFLQAKVVSSILNGCRCDVKGCENYCRLMIIVGRTPLVEVERRPTNCTKSITNTPANAQIVI